MDGATIQPNTTQVPNVILDAWMPRLSDVELRLLLIVVRQTLGWIEDPELKTRKTEDWISSSQLVEKSGRSRKRVSKAMKELIEVHQLVIAVDSKGRALDTAEKRRAKFGKIFYRLNVHAPAATLFDKIPSKINTSSRASKGRTEGEDGTKRRTQKGRTTKETHEQKEYTTTMRSAEPTASGSKLKKGNPDHKKFLAFWDDVVPRARGRLVKAIYTGADMKNLKRILDLGIEEQTLEQIALFFLADYSFKKFSPSISTFTAAGIITGLLNRMSRGNDPDFWKNLTRYMDQYLPKPAEVKVAEVRRVYDPEDPSTYSSMTSMQDAMKKMLDRFKVAQPTA